MPKKPSTNKRTRVKDLPKKEKTLSAKEMKKLKGGIWDKEHVLSGKLPGKSNISDGTYTTSVGPNVHD